MSDRIVPTGSQEDTFYQVWQRVTGKEDGKTDLAVPEMPEISLNEWIRRLLRQTGEREAICRSWQIFHRFVPLCRREREVLGTALFLRAGLRWQDRMESLSSGDLPQDCRKLCLFFRRSSQDYAMAAQSVEGQRLRQQMEQLAKSCHQAGEETERLLEEVLKRQGYI